MRCLLLALRSGLLRHLASPAACPHAAGPAAAPPLTRAAPACLPLPCSYAFPSLIKLTPAPLLQAARATVEGGRAARQWIEKQRAEDSA